ncbi:MAG: DUF6382 domain-containing protein [Lachnospiraceae bacterium]|nr:DUF6382 domain-containing protein [Lachnospiraceae bacterium]
MQRINFDRSASESYLVLDKEEDAGAGKDIEFETRMLSENRVDPFLPLVVQHIDHMVRYRYQVTGKTSVKQKFEQREIGAAILKTLIASVRAGLLSAEEYMLKETHILFDPAYIFFDGAQGSVSLCCCPLWDVTVQEGLQSLAEFLISVTDHKDNEAIDLSYGFFRLVSAGDLRFDSLLEAARDSLNDPAGPEILSSPREHPVPAPGKCNPKRGAASLLGFAAAFAIILCFTLCLLLLKFR